MVSLDVWLEYPGSENYVFSYNITHNLGKMASAVGIYQALWRPEEIGVQQAKQLIPLLTEGLAKLKSDPDEYRKHNASNGWGSYEGLVEFVTSYLEACKEDPEAFVTVSR